MEEFKGGGMYLKKKKPSIILRLILALIEFL